MTCIVGLVATTGDVWLGADCATAAGWTVHEVTTTKLVTGDGFVLGGAGSWRLIQVLDDALGGLARGELPPFAFVTRTLIPAVREAIKQAGVLKVKDGVEESPGQLLVAVASGRGARGALLQICEDWGVIETWCGYDAIGSGAEVALGAFFASPEALPMARLDTALKAAVAHRLGVRAPFRFACVRPDGTVSGPGAARSA